MIVAVLMICADDIETVTIHDGVADATSFLRDYVTEHWSHRFPSRPVPLDGERRIEAFFEHSDELYVLGEADVSEIAALLRDSH